ncbi:hypothetical protein QOZ80_7BG0584070 [Eleusine coracana subsp. coracana]|nr:hypothetical protein QOZ80_7BG0584070 [Eleusine coracana subsp. coracana]
MAESALSLARSVLGSAIGKMATAAAEEMSLLMGVQKEIWFMKDELKTMQAFLIAAEAMKNKKPLLKVWAEQVRSLSYDIEDCLDEFMVHVGSKSLSQQLIKLKDRHRIAVQIRNLKSRVEEVSSRNTRYNLIQIEDTEIDQALSYLEDVRNHSARNIDEAELVGTSTFKNNLLDKITAHYDDGHDRVICVVGMGGLGKTTLVRKIYESKEGIENKFPYRAWITVSQSLSRIDVLKGMIRQLFGDTFLETCLKSLDGMAAMQMQVDHLGKNLAEELKDKRYFVILDDLWDIGAWIWIRDICLPSTNNKANRIVITTRDASVAEACTTKLDCQPFILELKPLEKKHSIDLLLRKMRKSEQDMKNDEKLNTIVTKLVTKCGGLPLAIITIGAMFAAKHESEWDRLYTQLPAQLENNLSLEAIRSMVSLSYNHLPSCLKPCFLYLSIFPEDFEINRRRLVDRWIAEGLVGAQVGMNLEDVGNGYFNELINRSMILPSKVNIEGIVKSCRVHDIMRDIIVSLSREESFVYTSSDNVAGLAEDNFRHVAYHVSKCSMVGMDWNRVRSLTVFGERPIKHGPSLCSPQLRMRMIRAIDHENADFEVAQKDISNIGLLRHLKYVKMRSSKKYSESTIYALPRSIGRLKGLQVLDIGDSYISTLPTEICKLKSLRTLNINCGRALPKGGCLMFSLWAPILLPIMSIGDPDFRNEFVAGLQQAYSSRCSRAGGVKVPRGIGNLKELQILKVMCIKRTSSRAIEELVELSKLRKLGVNTEGATEKKCITLCKSIQKLSCLGSLQIDAGAHGTTEWVDSVSSLPLLRSLTLTGHIGDKVDWFRNLTQLVKLRLEQSMLEEGKAVEILGALPNLMLLDLQPGAYVGKKLVFRQGAFRNLRKLHCRVVSDELIEIRFEQGASPQMESIEVDGHELKLGINGTKNLAKLKEISLGYDCKVARLGMLQEEVNTHPNRPVMRLYRDRSYHDLGDPEGTDEYF